MVNFSKHVKAMQDDEGYYDDFNPFDDEKVEDKIEDTELSPEVLQEIEKTNRAIAKKINVPEYIQKLANVKGSEEDKLGYLSLYEGLEEREFAKYNRRVIPIIGAIVKFFPPFVSNTEKDENGKAKLMPGYEKPLFLTDLEDEDGNPIMIGGSKGLEMHVRAMCASRGWYIWERPVNYLFLYDGPGTPYRVVDQDRIEQMKAEREARRKLK